MAEILENKAFGEIEVGDSASLTRILRYEDLETWAAVTGNVNLVDAVETAAREGITPRAQAELGHEAKPPAPRVVSLLEGLLRRWHYF
jgi:hypothetical protein